MQETRLCYHTVKTRSLYLTWLDLVLGRHTRKDGWPDRIAIATVVRAKRYMLSHVKILQRGKTGGSRVKDP